MKLCSRCDVPMVADTSIVFTSNPPQYLYECPRCGKQEYGLCSENLEDEATEDEKIRKGLIEAVSVTLEGTKLFGTDVTREKALAWLEKQDPKKHEEELENAYKTADKVQYKRGYEDAVKEMEKQGETFPVLSNSSNIGKDEQKAFDYENVNIQQKDFAPKVEPKFKVGEKELTDEELREGLIRGMINEHNRVVKEVLRNEYEKGRADVLAKIDAIDVDEMVCESGATSRVTQYWYAHGVNDVIKKLKEEQV